MGSREILYRNPHFAYCIDENRLKSVIPEVLIGNPVVSGRKDWIPAFAGMMD